MPLPYRDPNASDALKAERALGTVARDGPAVTNTTCGVEVSDVAAFRRGMYVAVTDRQQGLEFLGRLVSGPFHPPLSNGPAEGAMSGTVEILGELGEAERLHPTLTRPCPGSPVVAFPAERLRRFLGIEGDLHLGSLTGHASVGVFAPSQSKNFLPRNVGIFGTVGAGKSNTAQVLVEEATAAGWAVVLVDVEGEYVCMDQPTADPEGAALLRERAGLEPEGVADVQVYVPHTARSAAAAARPFKIPFAALDPQVVADIMELSEVERRVLSSASERAERQYATDVPVFAGQFPPPRPYTLQQLLDGLLESSSALAGQPTLRLLPYAKPHEVAAASTLRSKLQYLARTGLLDVNETQGVPELPIFELLVPGRLSVLDAAEVDDRSRGLAIAYALQALFQEVVRTPVGEAMPDGRERPPLLVVVEEVHTFVSRTSAPRMRAVLDTLQTISRRGRKRWMALGLVSQQPNHVPDEIFELTNTRFIHQLKSLSNLEPVRQTTGSVDASLWQLVPALGAGRALLTGAAFPKPVFVDIRPARSRRLLVG